MFIGRAVLLVAFNVGGSGVGLDDGNTMISVGNDSVSKG